jgi:hypothetical protein
MMRVARPTVAVASAGFADPTSASCANVENHEEG